jgi:tRNA threonylcarbamoyladenosine modification (KEOPS) complex  Pcc1 subunit
MDVGEMYAATLSLEVQGAVARAVEGALAVEAEDGLPRVSARLERTQEDLQVHLVSEDLASLRAAINSFLRWASMAAEVSSGAERLMDNTYEDPAHQGG